MSDSQITFEDMRIVLLHVDLASFLDDDSVLNLSIASKECLKVVKNHISHKLLVPIWGSLQPIQPITYKIYQPTSFIWRHNITLAKHPEIDSHNKKISILLSSLHYNIRNFPKDTKRVKCLFEIIHMLEGLPNLTHLILRAFEFYKDPTYLEQRLIRQHTVDHLPITITHLKLIANLFVDNLPITLTHFDFGYYFNHPVDHLPPKLTHLRLSDSFEGYVDFLPQTLTHLQLGQRCNSHVDHLPSTLTHLTFGMSFNKPIDNLPLTVKVLKFYYQSAFDHYMDHLPHSLKVLKISPDYKRGLEYLPPNTKVKRL